MPDTSANLSLPYIQPSQAQKHVTHNEGMKMLDALVHLMVIASDQATPPASPQDGDRYILPASSSGEWAGQDGNLAIFADSSWVFYLPNSGWTAWADTPGEQIIYNGTNWVHATDTLNLQNLDMVGIATTANTTNRLAVASDATLFTHAGSGHQVKINKDSSSDTASLLFQTNWLGHAEMGTTGSDDFEIKVSHDGATFHQSMIADSNTGEVSFPSGVSGLSNSEFGNSSLITTEYSAAKGINLVANSTGLLGNSYNYPAQFTFDPVITPNLPASFSFSGYYSGLVQMEELLPVDPNQVYCLSSYIRQEGLSGDWSSYTHEEKHQQLMGLISLDADKLVISAIHHMRYKHSGTDSLTTLAAPLSPGDTSMTLVDASGWNELDSNINKRGVIIFGFQSSAGLSYEYYSRLVKTDLFDLGQVNKGINVVTFNKPLPADMGNTDDPGGTWPIGTSLANSSSGSSYKYSFYTGLHVDNVDQWYKTKGYMGGVDQSGTNNNFNFPPGTSYVKPFWLPNYTNRSGGYLGHPDTGSAHKVWFSGVSVLPEPHGVQSKVVSGITKGSNSIKVPNSDFATGSISLVPASMEVSEI